MSEITPFHFEQHDVRVLAIDGEPWWVVLDVCAAMGIANPHNVATRIKPHNLRQAEVPMSEFSTRPQRVNIINEPGLMQLIMRSDVPAAEKFQEWVYEEVLPSIRRTGAYLPVEFDEELRGIYELTVGMQRTRDEQRRLAQIQQEQGNQLVSLTQDVVDLKAVTPLMEAGHFDQSLKDVAHACDQGSGNFIKWMRADGILYEDSQKGGLRPYQDPWRDRGWAKERWERWPNGKGYSWVPYFTAQGLLEVKRRWVNR